jgi:phage terminase small subunit
MACYSRYARNLVSFNPMKPTDKFHFKMYKLCCAVANLTLKLHIHAKEHSEDKDNRNEKNQLTKLDHLTSDMCKGVV